MLAKSWQVSSLFSATDAENDTLTYYLYDSNTAANSGHFVINGNIVPAQTIYQLSAAQLAQTTFVAGAAGISDKIYVQAYDGHSYSGWNTYVNLNVAGTNAAPTVTTPAGANVNASSAAQVFQLSSLFAGSDAEDDALTYYLYDDNPAGGHFVVDGNIVPARTVYQLSATQLAQTIFVAGAAGTSDKIYVQAYDGHSYSGWNTYVNLSVAGTNTAPTVNTPAGVNVAASSGQSFQFSALFSGSDFENDTLTYYLYDDNPADSGHFVVNGMIVPAKTIYQLSAAQLAQATLWPVAPASPTNLCPGFRWPNLFRLEHVCVDAQRGRHQSAPTVGTPAGVNVAASAGSRSVLSLFAGSDSRRRHTDLLSL